MTPFHTTHAGPSLANTCLINTIGPPIFHNSQHIHKLPSIEISKYSELYPPTFELPQSEFASSKTTVEAPKQCLKSTQIQT